MGNVLTLKSEQYDEGGYESISITHESGERFRINEQSYDETGSGHISNMVLNTEQAKLLQQWLNERLGDVR